MLPTSMPQSSTEHSNLTPKILESRDQYHPCHVRLPGEERRVAAVMVDGKYFSLSRVVKDLQKALESCTRLAAKGHETVITKLAKGNAVWRLEPDAYTDATTQAHLKAVKSAGELRGCRILDASDQYQACYIRVPDLDKRLAAVQIDGKYYGLLKVVESRQLALSIVSKLKPRGDEIVITRIAQSDAIWVLEPDAELDRG